MSIWVYGCMSILLGGTFLSEANLFAEGKEVLFQDE